VIGAEQHARFLSLVDGATSLVLSTHVNPDGDAIGSEVGLARFLAARGKRLRIVNDSATPESLRFIEDPACRAERYDPAVHDAVLAAADLVVLLDNSAPDRLARMEPALVGLAGRVLCIDHHPMREAPWADTIVDVGSAATAAMVYELVTGAGWQPDALAAEAIYVGLATDTGYFRFNSTSPHAHEIAAELLRLGVRPARAFAEVYERNSLAFTRLLGEALSAVEVSAAGLLASVRITLGQLDRLGARNVDTSEITTALLAIDGVRIVALFRELSGGRVKVSLRSKGRLDVHRLAGAFGGGGHRNASGIVMAGALDAVAPQVLGRAEALLAEPAEPAP